MELITKLFSGIGVALPCGLNAFLPLLVISALAKAKKITVAPGFEFMESWAVLLVLAGLVGVALTVDKIPQLEGMLGKVYWGLRPLAGGLAFAATVPSEQIITPLGFVIGAGCAAAMHYVNISLQPLMVATYESLTVFRPALSLAQDFFAVVIALLALTVSLVGGVLGLVVLGLLAWWMMSLRRRGIITKTQPGR